MSMISNMRRSKRSRMWLIVAVLIIAVIVFVFFEKARIWLFGVFAILLVALGLEVAETDLDLGTLVETGSISESVIERDANGNLVNIGAICDATDYNYNCDDFRSQEEAKAVADQCNFDVHGLDRDKDGLVCEHLPATTN